MASAEILPKLPLVGPLSEPQPLPAPSAAEALTPLIQSTYRTSELCFFVNGRRVTISNPNPDWVLLDWIRAQDNLKGTKLGCGEGGCGACTVVLQTIEKGRQLRHVAVNACLFPLVGVDGKSLITIEGLGTVDRPHPLQERIAKMQLVTSVASSVRLANLVNHGTNIEAVTQWLPMRLLYPWNSHEFIRIN